MRRLMFLFGAVVMLLTTSCLKGPTSGGTSESSFKGKLVVTNMENGKTTYTDDNAALTVTIPDILQPKLDLLFLEVKFADAMPYPINMELKGIPFVVTVSDDGMSLNYTFEAENVIPTDFEQYPINKVKGCLGRVIDVEFEMASRGSRVRFTTNTGDSENNQ